MAKKKKKKKSKKHNSSFKKIISLLFITIIIVLIADSCGSKRIYTQLPQPVKEQIDALKTSIPDFPITNRTTTQHYEELHIPARLNDREEQIIHHKGYSVSYNEEWRLPNWTGYELTREKTKGTEPRAKHFKPNPRILGISATNQDYSQSGYDRGHMVPAGDMKWCKEAMEESFYFSNICPQLHNLNAGDWKELEDKVREWAIKDSAIIVMSGPIIDKSSKRIGVNKVIVPKAFYKVVLSPYSTKPQAIGFIMEHKKCNNSLRKYAVTVDSVETITGIDFFSNLPKELEEKLEKEFSLGYWGL